MVHNRKHKTAAVVMAVFLLQGCMSFTQRDYDLQEEAYQKERQQKEEQMKDAWKWDW